MTYRERPPPPALRGLVECLWFSRNSAGERHIVLPDGGMDLVWTGSALLVAGPDTMAHPTDRAPGVLAVGVRFQPGALPALLDVPAADLRDLRVQLADLNTAVARPALGRLEGGESAPAVLLGLLAQLPGAPPDRGVPAMLANLNRPVSAIADTLGCTPRTVHRLSRDAFGYGPAVLRRVLRFRRAVDLLLAGRPVAEVAARAGYADQPHLSREVRAMAGSTPGQLASGANRSTPLPSGSWTTA